MQDLATDEQFLHRALDLARQGIGLASPNPYVGAVIVDAHGNIVGTGTYTYEGVKHAEVLALEAGRRQSSRRNALHQSRTARASRAHASVHRRSDRRGHSSRGGIACPILIRKSAGRGFEKLRAAGVQVEVGRLEAEARRLNEAFARYIRHGMPLVTLKAAMTLDGKIAPPPASASKPDAGIPAGGWMTGEAARAHVQEQRHQSDAILVGVGTILADDPLLTDRSGNPRTARVCCA